MTVKYRPIKGTNALIDEEQYASTAEIWRDRKAATGGWSFSLKFRSKTGGPLSESSAGANDPASSGQYGGAVSPDYVDGGLVAPAGRPIVLAQVLRQEETSSNLVRIVRDIQDADGSGPSSEGAAYGLAEEHPQPHDWHVNDTTAVVPVTEDFLSDVPSAMSYLTKRLSYLVQRAEETKLVAGNGTDPNLLGLLNAADGDETATSFAFSGTLTTSTAQLIDATYDASGLEPEWVAMSSTSWLKYATEFSGSGTSYLAGPANRNGPRTLWGLPVVLSNAIPNVNVIVGSSQAVGRWVHTSGIKVDMSPGYSTYFGQGLVAVRAKIRTTLAYEHPSGIGVMTGV